MATVLITGGNLTIVMPLFKSQALIAVMSVVECVLVVVTVSLDLTTRYGPYKYSVLQKQQNNTIPVWDALIQMLVIYNVLYIYASLFRLRSRHI